MYLHDEPNMGMSSAFALRLITEKDVGAVESGKKTGPEGQDKPVNQ
jgi:hypothetical protein